MQKTDLFEGGRAAIGSWITLAHPAVAEIMSASGFDWLAIDMEHSVITIREAEELIRIVDLSGVIPLVRLTSNNSDQIKRVMDAGAHGIIVPMVNSAEDARKAVASVKYPTHGKRGVGLARAQKYGADFVGYQAWQETSPLIIAQIEHIDAVRNFKEILAVPGISGFIIGPYDLSGSMGIPGAFDNPQFLQVMDDLRRMTDELKAIGGVHVIEPDPEQLQSRLDEGYRFIAYSLDIRMLDRACRDGLSTLGDKKK